MKSCPIPVRSTEGKTFQDGFGSTATAASSKPLPSLTRVIVSLASTATAKEEEEEKTRISKSADAEDQSLTRKRVADRTLGLKNEKEDEEEEKETDHPTKRCRYRFGQPPTVVNKDDTSQEVVTVMWAPRSLTDIIGNAKIWKALEAWIMCVKQSPLSISLAQTLIPNLKRERLKAVSRRPRPTSGTRRFCVVHGPPGVGKSTGVRLLARKHGFSVHEYKMSERRTRGDVEAMEIEILARANDRRSVEPCMFIMEEVDGISPTSAQAFCSILTSEPVAIHPWMVVCVGNSYPRMLHEVTRTHGCVFAFQSLDARELHQLAHRFCSDFKMDPNHVPLSPLVRHADGDARLLISSLDALRKTTTKNKKKKSLEMNWIDTRAHLKTSAEKAYRLLSSSFSSFYHVSPVLATDGLMSCVYHNLFLPSPSTLDHVRTVSAGMEMFSLAQRLRNRLVLQGADAVGDRLSEALGAWCPVALGVTHSPTTPLFHAPTPFASYLHPSSVKCASDLKDIREWQTLHHSPFGYTPSSLAAYYLPLSRPQ